MATKKLFQKRIDAELLEDTEKIFNEVGTTVGDAFVLFLAKARRVGGIPFMVRVEEEKRLRTTEEIFGEDWAEGLDDVEDTWE